MTLNTIGLKADLTRFFDEEIKSFIMKNPDNRLKDIDDSPIFEEPLVGFASGDDPIFGDYKNIIGDFHLTPGEVMEKHLREVVGVEQPEVNGTSVIVWCLPFAKGIRLASRQMTDGPSLHWNHGRWHGQAMNDAVARHVVSLLEEQGHRAVAPDKEPFFKVTDLPNGRCSNWSQRHALYAAGMGTFGLTDAFITPKGMAMRCGSVVTDLKLTPTPRTYASHVANCPFLVDGTCGECIKRCPAGALSAQGHDKIKCRENVQVTQNSWLEKPGYIGKYAGCGLCQTKVPCEAGIPAMASPR
jgi:ferredoxin